MSKFKIDQSILLIDGNNIINRSYHIKSLQNLQTSYGLKLGALYGFLNSVFKIAEDNMRYKLVVCWDGGRSNRRMALKETYKNRKKREDTTGQVPLYDQIAMAEEILGQMGVPSLRYAGVEADDIIAVLSREARGSLIYSNDKDFAQLIRPGHRWVRTATRNEEYFDHNNLEKIYKHGLTPLETRLFLAISGDAIDGVPGIKGIGDKTAIYLLKYLRDVDYGSSVLEVNGGSTHMLKKAAKDIMDSGVPRMNRLAYVESRWEDFERSLALVDLWREDLLDPEIGQECIEKVEERTYFSRDLVQELFDKYEFMLDIDSMEECCKPKFDEESSLAALFSL